MESENHAISVENKVILLTGAFGLIGREVSQSLLKHGAKVILSDVNQKVLPSVHEQLLLSFPKEQFLVTKLDITDEQSIAECIEQITVKFGRIDVLINNAAIDAKFDRHNQSAVNASRFENYPIELLQKSIEVNLTGTVRITQAVCRQMLKQGSGNIINVASTYSLVAPNQQLYDYGAGEEIRYKPVDYIATKSFIPNFTRYIATFYAKEGIRCNAIVPHGIYNDHEEKFLINFSKYSPLGRMCDRSELNGPFIFLSSDASSYMTGSVMVVDGGWTAW
jgi:NAD(P)-dependent dehydrogenase (short-subunit alcohol dehydrogenase family)